MSYKNLEVWQLAREVVIKIHKMSLNELPKFELYETGSQIRRSSKSVKSNIVEGYGRRSYKQDFIKFLIYSLSSNDETLDHLETLFETESFTNKSLYNELHSKVELLGKKLNKFIQSVEKGHNMYNSNNEPEKLFVKNPESPSQNPVSSIQNPESSFQNPVSRCDWCTKDEQYIKYHDEEWGIPVHDDRTHFEMLILEGAQAGLNWLMILRKRENYRKTYDNFNAKKVAKYNDEKMEELLLNAGIIRNRAKIKASISNAKAFLEVQKEFGSFDKYIWQFVNNKPIINKWKTISEVPATSKESDELSKDLKKRGFKFVGSTIIYAHMQSIGMVNDHLTSCHKYKQLS